MSAQDVANAAYQAGFRGNGLVTAIAVSLAEDPSSDPGAQCLNCLGVPEDSRGIFQINVNAHPQWAGLDLYDPVVNAQIAYQLSGGGSDWSPWSTYIYGTYQAHLARAQALAASVGQGGVPSPTRPDLSVLSNSPGRAGGLVILALIAIAFA